jgi:hypothetical protein
MQREKEDSNIKREEKAKKGATRAWACVPFCFGFRFFLGLTAALRAFFFPSNGLHPKSKPPHTHIWVGI